MCIATSQPFMPSAGARARHVSAPALASLAASTGATLSLSWKSKTWLGSQVPPRTFCRLRHRSLEEGDLPVDKTSLNSTDPQVIASRLEQHRQQCQTTCPSLPSCSTTTRSPADSEAPSHESTDQVKVKSVITEKMFNPSLPLKSLPGRIVVDESPPHRWPSDDPGGGRTSTAGCHPRKRQSSLLLRQELFLILVSLSLLLTGFAQPVQGESESYLSTSNL